MMKRSLEQACYKGLEVYVGTSGWMYDWNPDGFEWFVKNSGLNAVELNMSFYRFPFPNQVKSWASKTPTGFRWSVKVSRFVTHVFKFSDRAFETWKKFERLFAPLDDKVDFYLFQLPPYLAPTQRNVERIEKFVRKTNLNERFALEWRNESWFDEKWVSWCESLGVTLVSVDSPDFQSAIFSTNGLVYLRMHGRTFWYSHNYSLNELEEVVEKALAKKPKKLYVFFNNDHDMLHNARETLELLRKKLSLDRSNKPP